MRKIPSTQEEIDMLTKERNHLVNIERIEIIKAIAAARELGDLSENAEYHSAREKQSFIEGRIQELNNFINQSEIIDVASIKSDEIKFGATVTVIDLDTNEEKVYKLVGAHLSNPSKGLISFHSPFAKELMGKKNKDIIEFVANNKHTRVLEIKKIEYK